MVKQGSKTPKKALKAPKKALKDPEKTLIDPEKALKKPDSEEIQGWLVKPIIKDSNDDAHLNFVIGFFEAHMSTLKQELYKRIRQMHTIVSFELSPRTQYNFGAVIKITFKFLWSAKLIISINLDQSTIDFKKENFTRDTDHNTVLSFGLLLTQKLIDEGFEKVETVHSDKFDYRENSAELYLHKR
jgi:hypothetical protein